MEEEKYNQLDGGHEMLPPVCAMCKHLEAYGKCKAFDPKPIPWEIWDGKNDHTKPYPGDHGIQFERLDVPDKGAKKEASMSKESEFTDWVLPGAKSQETVKHIQGQHDQKSHGFRGMDYSHLPDDLQAIIGKRAHFKMNGKDGSGDILHIEEDKNPTWDGKRQYWAYIENRSHPNSRYDYDLRKDVVAVPLYEMFMTGVDLRKYGGGSGKPGGRDDDDDEDW